MNESQRIQAELNVERGFSAGHTIRIEHACARMQPKSGTEGCTVFGSHPPVTVEEAQRLASRSAGMSRRESRLHRSHVPDLKSTVKSRQNHFNPSKLFNIIVVMLNTVNLGRKRRFSAVLSIQALRLPLSANSSSIEKHADEHGPANSSDRQRPAFGHVVFESVLGSHPMVARRTPETRSFDGNSTQSRSSMSVRRP